MLSLRTSASQGMPWLRSRRTMYILRLAALGLLLSLAAYELCQNLLAAHAEFPPIQSSVFLDTDTPVFTLHTSASSGNLLYSVSNSAGATLLQSRVSADGSQATITLPRLPDDYYQLQLTDQTGSQTVKRSLPFVVLAPFQATEGSPLGVGVHFTGGNNPHLAGLIEAMGATSIRDDASWSLIERQAGSYDFGHFDAYMQTLQEDHLSPLLILDYSNRFYDQNKTPYDSAGLQAFAHYAQALVQHYGPRLQAVEVYNEFNGTLSTGPCARNPQCYVNLLRVTYQAVKAVRPDVQVVGGAAFMADLSWFQKIFADGGLAYMDIVSDHPYTSLYITSPEAQGLEKEMQKLRDLIKSANHGQSKPVWITELGWTTSLLHVSAQTQASYLVRGTVLSLAAGVQKIFWYDLLNDGTSSTNVEQNFGLLNQPDGDGIYTPKPAYAAYAVLARELAGRTLLNREGIAPGIFSMHFSGDLRVLWTTPVPQSVALKTDHPLTLISLSGRVQTLKPVNGMIILHLLAQPVYVQGSISGISWHLL